MSNVKALGTEFPWCPVCGYRGKDFYLSKGMCPHCYLWPRQQTGGRHPTAGVGGSWWVGDRWVFVPFVDADGRRFDAGFVPYRWSAPWWFAAGKVAEKTPRMQRRGLYLRALPVMKRLAGYGRPQDHIPGLCAILKAHNLRANQWEAA